MSERLRALVVTVVLFAVVGVVLALVIALSGDTGLVVALVVLVPSSAVFAAIAAAAGRVCRVIPFSLEDPWRPASIHFAGGLLTAALWSALVYGWSRIAAELLGFSPLTEEPIRLVFLAGLLFYLLSVAVHYLLLQVESTASAQEKALELRALTREAELEALKAKINPHFLFNSLNSISALCRSDPQGARTMAERLARFYRKSTEMTRHTTIPLGQELDLAREYLTIEHVRFGERLSFSVAIDEEVAAIEIPPLTLQPLVENAVRHGIAQRVDGGEISIEAISNGEYVKLLVENDVDPDTDDGGRETADSGLGVGQENVRNRLRAWFGDAARLRIMAGESRYRVAIAIPISEERRVSPR